MKKLLSKRTFIKGREYSTDDIYEMQTDIERHFEKIQEDGYQNDLTERERCLKTFTVEIYEKVKKEKVI